MYGAPPYEKWFHGSLVGVSDHYHSNQEKLVSKISYADAMQLSRFYFTGVSVWISNVFRTLALQ